MEQERGERGGVVLDGDTDVDQGADAGAGGESDAALTQIEKTDDAIDEQGGTADLDRGTEDQEAGKDDRHEEGEVLENGEKPGPLDDTRIKTIEQTLKEVSDKLNAPKTEPAKPLSDEDWQKIEQEWGSPRSTIERITQQNVKVVNKLTDYIDSKFAKLEFGQTLNDFAKKPGFTDATRYKADIQTFMNRYEPKHWSNPDLIEEAVYYARGRNANTNIQKARTETERNRKIAVNGRPSAPAGGGRRSSLPPLNQAQREAAAMMPGGEAEYNRFRSRPSRVIE